MWKIDITHSLRTPHHPPQQDPVSTNRNGNVPIWVVKRKCCDFDCSFRLLLLLPLPRAIDESDDDDDVETAINRVDFYCRNQSHSAGFFAKLNFDGSFQSSNSNESQFPRMHCPTRRSLSDSSAGKTAIPGWLRHYALQSRLRRPTSSQW